MVLQWLVFKDLALYVVTNSNNDRYLWSKTEIVAVAIHSICTQVLLMNTSVLLSMMNPLFFFIYITTVMFDFFLCLYSMDLVVPQSSLTRSHGCLYESSDNHRDSSQYMGFEEMWQNNNYQLEVCI